MILWRRVIERPNQYNFAMHVARALVTNFFPADYDYEAPVQTLRHRLYITMHALDRRFTGSRDNRYSNNDTILCNVFECIRLLFDKRAARDPLLRVDDRTLEVEGFIDEDDRMLGALFESLRIQSLPPGGDQNCRPW